MIDNADACLAFAQERGLGVNRMEDIVLVTGHHRVGTSANIAFSKSEEKRRIALEVAISGRPEESNVEWQLARGWGPGVAFNVGPSRGIVVRTSMHNFQENSDALQNLPRNQCIFIRGFRVKRITRTYPCQTRRVAATPMAFAYHYQPEPDVDDVQYPFQHFNHC